MTDPEEGLPTALEVKEKVSIGAEFEPTDYFKDEVVEGDELVRRKDHEKKLRVAKSEKYQEGYVNGIEHKEEEIKELIQDKIEQAEEKIEKYNAFDKLNLNDVKARKQELESLLEELEQ